MNPIIDLANVRPRPDRRQSGTATEIATGVRRLMAGYGYASVTEMTLASGRRADVVGLGADGCVWIVEIKSSVADFRADAKWPDYSAFCDRLFFAVPTGFPTDILPTTTGLMLADAYGAALVREAPEHKLAGARRRAVMVRFAHLAAGRLHRLVDPDGAGGWME